MKDVFFTLVAVSLPLLALLGVIYLFLRGLYTVFSDWRLGRELEELRQEASSRRLVARPAQGEPYDPVAAFSDEPPPQEPTGILTLPLDPIQPSRSPAPPSVAPTFAMPDVAGADFDVPELETPQPIPHYDPPHDSLVGSPSAESAELPPDERETQASAVNIPSLEIPAAQESARVESESAARHTLESAEGAPIVDAPRVLEPLAPLEPSATHDEPPAASEPEIASIPSPPEAQATTPTEAPATALPPQNLPQLPDPVANPYYYPLDLTSISGVIDLSAPAPLPAASPIMEPLAPAAPANDEIVDEPLAPPIATEPSAVPTENLTPGDHSEYSPLADTAASAEDPLDLAATHDLPHEPDNSSSPEPVELASAHHVAPAEHSLELPETGEVAQERFDADIVDTVEPDKFAPATEPQVAATLEPTLDETHNETLDQPHNADIGSNPLGAADIAPVPADDLAPADHSLELAETVEVAQERRDADMPDIAAPDTFVPVAESQAAATLDPTLDQADDETHNETLDQPHNADISSNPLGAADIAPVPADDLAPAEHSLELAEKVEVAQEWRDADIVDAVEPDTFVPVAESQAAATLDPTLDQADDETRDGEPESDAVDKVEIAAELPDAVAGAPWEPVAAPSETITLSEWYARRDGMVSSGRDVESHSGLGPRTAYWLSDSVRPSLGCQDAGDATASGAEAASSAAHDAPAEGTSYDTDDTESDITRETPSDGR